MECDFKYDIEISKNKLVSGNFGGLAFSTFASRKYERYFM